MATHTPSFLLKKSAGILAATVLGLVLFGGLGSAQAYEPGAPCTYQGVSYPEGSIIRFGSHLRICVAGTWRFYEQQTISPEAVEGKVDVAGKVPSSLPGGPRLSSGLEQTLRNLP